MKSFTNIKKPCNEPWDKMTDLPDGKFCAACSKKVWDLTQKDSDELKSFLEINKGICGRISKINKSMVSTVLIAVSLSSASCANNQHSNHHSVNDVADKKLRIIGRIDSVKVGIIEPFSIKLVTKSKLFEGKIDFENNFEIEIPESEIREHNIIKIDFRKTQFNKNFNDYSLHLLTKKDLLSGKTLHADDGLFEIGAVVIISPPPDDYYFFDGKVISENTYYKLISENPDFEKIILDKDVYTRVITKNSNVGTIFLLYSK